MSPKNVLKNLTLTHREGPKMVAAKNLLETSQHHTAPLWPRYVPNRSPLCAYHAVGVWSLAQENSKSPSLLYLRNVSGLSCPFNKIGLISPLSFRTKPASEFTKCSPQNPNRNSHAMQHWAPTEQRQGVRRERKKETKHIIALGPHGWFLPRQPYWLPRQPSNMPPRISWSGSFT